MPPPNPPPPPLFPFQKNPENLDPFYMMDLDSGIVLEAKNNVFQPKKYGSIIRDAELNISNYLVIIPELQIKRSNRDNFEIIIHIFP